MTATKEKLLYLLGDLSKGIRKYSEGKIDKGSIYSTLNNINRLVREEEEYFRPTFAAIDSQFSEPLQPPSSIKNVEEFEKGLMKKYGLKHPDINDLATFYTRKWNKFANGSGENTVTSPFSSTENFSTHLQTHIDETINQFDEVRKLNRTSKDIHKQRLIKHSTYKLVGFLVPIANKSDSGKASSSVVSQKEGSSISVGRIFLSAALRTTK